MPLNLRGVNAKLRRASEHADTVKNEARLWMDSGFYSVTRETNADRTSHSLVLHVSQAADVEDWALIVGDAIHNLRSALDHLIYAIAVHETNQFPPPDDKWLFLPICDTPEHFREMSAKPVRKPGGIKSLSLGVRTAIESIQPYNRLHPSLPPILGMLQEFDIADKHKLLRLMFASMYQWKVGMDLQNVIRSGKVRIIVNAGELKDGAEIVTTTFDHPAPDVNYDGFEFFLIFALNHPAGPDGSIHTDFASLLSLMIAEVRTVIDIIVAKVV